MSFISYIKALLPLGRGIAGGLPQAVEDKNPIELFQVWFEAAQKSGLLLPEAMSLATATPDGVPSVRMVLLKDADHRGFTFYTNYGSRKASEIDENPVAALCFHWPILQCQIRISGRVSRVTQAESSDYFQTRSRPSRIGAWASKQSKTLSERVELEARVHDYHKKFADDDIPLPPFWGGYRLNPEQIEFWQGRTDRLHDRVLFKKWPDGWQGERLYP